MSLYTFKNDHEFLLESGVLLPKYHLAYNTFGKLNSSGDNVVWIFHALTANSDPSEWWPMIIGKNKLFDPENEFIICVNMPGSCYGSLGPLSINPETGKPYYHDFPFFTTRDMIRSYKALREHLGIRKIKVGIGGSMGGQQLLEWAIEEPDLFEYIFPIATNAVHSPWGIAFNESQRLCIETDSTWNQEDPSAGMEGMKTARGVALLSYRHYETYEDTQKEEFLDKLSGYKAQSYQKYQGEKLAKRFNAFSYYVLSKSMDSHNVGRGRGSVENALQTITAHTTVIAIETDILFPPQEQKFIAEHIPSAHLHKVHSHYGHDGFLLEYNQITHIVTEAMAEAG